MQFDYSKQRLAEQIKFTFPQEVHHNKNVKVIYPVFTDVDKIIKREIIEPIYYPQLYLTPKRYFLLYGVPGCGKSTNVFKIYKALLNHKKIEIDKNILPLDNVDIPDQQNTQKDKRVIHLKTNCKNWIDSPNQHWDLIVEYIQYIANQYEKILFEIENIEVWLSLLSKDHNSLVFRELISITNVYVVGTTIDPKICERAFQIQDIGVSIFINNPLHTEIKELLKTTIYYICDPEGKNDRLETIKIPQFDNFLTVISKRIGRIPEKQQQGISMSTFTNFLLPQFVHCIMRARLNWYNSEQKCFYIQPVQIDLDSDPKIHMTPQDLIKKLKKFDLTLKEMRALNILIYDSKTQEDMEFVPDVCPLRSEIQLDWSWFAKAFRVIQIIGDVIFIYLPDPEEVQLYQALEKYSLLK